MTMDVIMSRCHGHMLAAGKPLPLITNSADCMAAPRRAEAGGTGTGAVTPPPTDAPLALVWVFSKGAEHGRISLALV